MAGTWKNLGKPDDVLEFPGCRIELIDLGDLTVSRARYEPGWRWSTHIKPQVGGEWCQAHHIGVVLSGRLGISFPDGTTIEIGPYDVYDLLPGHDGFVIGHEPTESIEWSGVRAFAGFRAGTRGRVLTTLLIIDIVGSTAHAARLGDSSWRDLLSTFFNQCRDFLDRFIGREVKTTGDGMIATFDGTANAIACAEQMIKVAAERDLEIRCGVHVGEVDLIGSDVRGVAVHEAERVSSAAGSGEIYVSETTRALGLTSGLQFEDRGLHALKGIPEERRLYAVVRSS